MEKKQYCFSFAQAADCAACPGEMDACPGKCGAPLWNALVGALIGLARAMDASFAPSETASRAMRLGLLATAPNTGGEVIRQHLDTLKEEKDILVPSCRYCASPCGRTSDYDMALLWNAPEDVRSLKLLLLSGLRSMAAYALHAEKLGYADETVNAFFCEALFKIGYEETAEDLLPVLHKLGETERACLGLLERAYAQKE